MGARPYTIIFSTSTVDGRIASSTGYSMLSCPYDKRRLLLLRGYTDAVMVGAGTVEVDDPGLRKRLMPRSERFYRVIVDGRLRLHSGYRVFREPDPQTILFTATSDEERIAVLEKLGVRVHVVGRDGIVDLGEALELLAEEYGVQRLLVEGGGILNYSLLSARLVDEVRVTYTPVVFAAGRSVFQDPEGRGFTTREEGPRLRLLCSELCPCGNCVHAVYRVEDAAGAPVARGGVPWCLSHLLPRLAEPL